MHLTCVGARWYSLKVKMYCTGKTTIFLTMKCQNDCKCPFILSLNVTSHKLVDGNKFWLLPITIQTSLCQDTRQGIVNWQNMLTCLCLPDNTALLVLFGWQRIHIKDKRDETTDNQGVLYGQSGYSVQETFKILTLLLHLRGFRLDSNQSLNRQRFWPSCAQRTRLCHPNLSIVLEAIWKASCLEHQ